MPNLVGDSSDPGVAAIHGTHTNGVGGPAAIIGHSEGRGVLGISGVGQGVWGASTSSTGVVGVSESGAGVSGESTKMDGVVGLSSQAAGVHGRGPTGGLFEGGSVAAVHAVALGNALAGFFKGDVEVTGDIRLVNADCAEDFDVAGAESIEPGTVMVLGEEGGVLHQSRQAYDKRVAGVVSGAGGYKPGIVLDKQDTQANRVPLALLGKVYCKVDASCGPIEVGDLLTTSDRPGHAMKAADPLKAFGSIIGKALRPFRTGQGLIPILIALQ